MLLFGLMAWTTEKEAIIIVQFLYGTFMACEVAYYTYIYAKVERSKYQLVTGHTRSAILAGRFFGAVLAQLLISFSLMNYRELLYISFGCKYTIPIIPLIYQNNKIKYYFFAFFIYQCFSSMFFIDIRFLVTIRKHKLILLCAKQWNKCQ